MEYYEHNIWCYMVVFLAYFVMGRLYLATHCFCGQIFFEVESFRPS